MGIPLILLTLIFMVWLHYELLKSKKQDGKKDELFWKREEQGNLTPRKDISSLDYITITLDHLPVKDYEDETINLYRDTIKALSNQKILNLSGLTNTDLKLQYGVANLNLLTEYDNNYIKLVSILHKWGERLYNIGDIKAATSVLEYAVFYKTDALITYKLLAQIYHKVNSIDKIDELIELILVSNMSRKDELVRELRTLKDS
ncbi:MAG: hypothetical protein GX915_03440 [Clostridiales bacterium]|nr:hypothetical protein [Clostridiales bacterium]